MIIKIPKIAFIAIFALLILTSCVSSQELEPTFTPSPTATLIPTNTPLPTPTITPTPVGSGSGKILHASINPEIVKEEVYEIFITDFATSKTTRISPKADSKTSYSSPAVSKDGKKIAFSKSKNDGATYYGEPFWIEEIFIMDITGENLEKISGVPMYSGQDRIDDFLQEFFPSWSPDNKKIAFVSNRNSLVNNSIIDDYEIFTIDLTTYKIIQLTKAQGYSLHPSWSPDGEFITFMSNRDGDWDIFYMKSDGSGKDIKITNNIVTDRYPSWSNDGKKIIYHSDRDGQINLYLYEFEKKEEIQITNHPGSEFTARWSPDDKWIVFASDRDGDEDIFILNLETKEEIKITNNEISDGFQSWIP